MSLILFSIFIQSLIIQFNSFSFQFLSRVFPFSNDFFILFGNFSLSLIKSSLKYKLLNLLSTSNKISSSLSFKIFLIFVNIFCILILNFLYFHLFYQIKSLNHLLIVLIY